MSVQYAMGDFGVGGQCPCGGLQFERVVLQRPGRAPYSTDMVACSGCGAVFLSPVPPPKPAEHCPGHNIGTIGPALPPRTWPSDSKRTLKRDAAEAAKEYRKPGQDKPPR